MSAAAGGHDAMVLLLLQSGAEVNAADQVMRRRRDHLGNQRLPNIVQYYIHIYIYNRNNP